MSSEKPGLIAFSQHALGGVQSFYYNLLSNDPEGFFEKSWILLEGKGHPGVLPPAPYNLDEIIVKYDPANGSIHNSTIIEAYISNDAGVVLANHKPELDALQLYPKSNKVVFYLVHDVLYLALAREYINVIDVLVTHNYGLYEELLALFPFLSHATFFLPYGINLAKETRMPKPAGVLKIAFVGRLCYEKGIYDLIKIDDLLKRQNVKVEWTIIGDGPEKENFRADTRRRKNFTHKTLGTTEQIFNELKTCDIYILPSVLDGTPVALLESMSVGLVPLIYRFNNGIKKVVTEDIGYVTEIRDVEQMASIIKKLDADRELLEAKSANALRSARANFDVADRAKDYYDLFKRFAEFKREKSYQLVDMTPFIEVSPEPSLIRKMKWKIKDGLKYIKRKAGI